jgi:hypothetical protein
VFLLPKISGADNSIKLKRVKLLAVYGLDHLEPDEVISETPNHYKLQGVQLASFTDVSLSYQHIWTAFLTRLVGITSSCKIQPLFGV